MARKTRTEGSAPDVGDSGADRPLAAGPAPAETPAAATVPDSGGAAPEVPAGPQPALPPGGVLPSAGAALPEGEPAAPSGDAPAASAEPLLPEPPAGPAIPAFGDPLPPPAPPDAARPVPPAPIAPPRRSAAPLLLAGIVTAGLGLAAGWYLWRPGGPLAPDAAITEARLAELDSRLSQAESALKGAAEQEAVTTGLAALSGRVEAAERAAADAAAAAEAQAARLTELARRPPETDAAATAAYERELAALRESSEARLAEMQKMLADEIARIRAESAAAAQAQEQAAAVEDRAETRAALAAVTAALEAGTPFAEPLDRLAGLDDTLPVGPLRAHAEGVPTLAALQSAFPEAARAAIAAEAAAGRDPGAWGFLKGQLGMRSLSPQEGGGADAVLSRAEAALKAGDVAGALAGLDALGPEAAQAMAGWRERAERRQAALAALQTLTGAVEK